MRLVIAAAALACSGIAAAQPVVTLQSREALISVEAQGEFASRPDTMILTAGTVTTGATAAEAVAANNALARRLVEAVRGAGIDPGDVRTSDFDVEPRFQGGHDEPGRNGLPPRIIGYVAENRIELRLRDLANADALISRLFEAGANSVRGPIFSLADDRQARRAAERAAIAEARAEAENYAAAFGRRLGRLLRVSDRRVWTEAVSDETILVSGSRIPPTPIEPGEVMTTATVYVDFALAPE